MGPWGLLRQRHLVILSAASLVAFAACSSDPPLAAAPDAGTQSDDTDVPDAPTAEPTGTGTSKPPPAPNPDEALPPELDTITPSSAIVGSIGPSVVVSGKNFVARSIVQLDGAPLATSFVSDTELRATVPSSKLVTVGTLRLSVGTSGPGGGASKEVLFAVENPVPAMTVIAPLAVTIGAGQTTLKITGSSFVSGAKITFGTTELATTVVNANAVEGVIPANLLSAPGAVPVKVENPAPGGGASNVIAFTVANPDAAIQSITPSSAFVGAGALDLTVNGGGFIDASTVIFNGTSLATTRKSPAQLTAKLPAILLGSAGDYPVSVVNPPPGGGVTGPVVFRVQYPVPTATSVSPGSLVAGSAPTDITVTGLGFFLNSQITFDNAPAATTYVDATHLTARLTAAQLASSGAIAVRVITPAPGGGTSGAIPFSVTNPAPVITSLSPSSVKAGAADTTISIYGTGFVSKSTVSSNGVSIASTLASATRLTAVVPSNQLVNFGNISITVTNPAPGGGTSEPKTLTVGCDTTGTNVFLSTIGTTLTYSTAFSTAASLSRFTGASSCAVTSVDPNNLEPGRYWVVQNMTGKTATLSAWADCTKTGKDDAYLTFYRRPTAPANDAERLACAFAVAEGINGEGGYSSPDSGGSMYCPGLTKANGGGLTLAACEKAVVHVQPWSYTSTTYPPPPYVKMKIE